MMTSQMAQEFLRALDAIGPYVPPMHYRPLLAHPLVQLAGLVAAGQIEIHARSLGKPQVVDDAIAPTQPDLAEKVN